MPATVRLYFHEFSHYCVTAERALRYKGIRAKVVRVPLDDRRALLRATGQDYIPALLWGTRFVPWSEIPRFLEGKLPSPTLFPPGQEALAEVLQNWAHQVVEDRVWKAVVTDLGPQLKSQSERWVFEEIQDRARGPWHVLQARRKEFSDEMEGYLGRVDRLLKGRSWVLGEPSIADFALFGAISPLRSAGRPLPRKLSRLRAWYHAIEAL